MYELPKHITIENIIKSRLVELNIFLLKFKCYNDFSRHLQRRKASYKNHNRKNTYNKSFENILNRKIRRKGKKMKKMKNRLNRNPKVLSSHIWHSKRFQMYVRWGWKIPYGKHIGEQYLSFNVNKECLIQDLSFFNFLKISGTKVILDSFFGDWILPRSIQISKNFYLLYKETKKSTFVSPIHLFSLNETKYLFIVHPKAIKKLKKEIKVVLVEYKIKIVIETGRHGLFQLIGYKSISIIHVVLNISRFLFILEQYVEVSTFKNNPIIIIRMGKYTQYKAFLVFLFDTPDYLDLWMKFQFYKVKAIGWINRKLVAKHWNTLSFPFIQPIICTFEELEQKNVKDSIINAFIYVINKGRPLSGARIYLKDTEEDIGWIIQSGFCKFCSKSFGYGFVKKYFFRFINIYFMNPRSDKIFKAILMTKLYKKNEIYHTN